MMKTSHDSKRGTESLTTPRSTQKKTQRHCLYVATAFLISGIALLALAWHLPGHDGHSVAQFYNSAFSVHIDTPRDWTSLVGTALVAYSFLFFYAGRGAFS